MGSVSSILVLLDLMEAGLRINSAVAAYIREKEAAGEPIDGVALKALANTSDESFKKLKDIYGK